MSLVHRDRKQRRWQNSWIIETKRFIVWLQPTKDLLVGVGVSYSGSEYLGIHFHTQVASNDSRVSVGRTSVINYSVWRVKWSAIPLDFPVSQLIWSYSGATNMQTKQRESKTGSEVRNTLCTRTQHVWIEIGSRKQGAETKCDVSLWKWRFVACSVE